MNTSTNFNRITERSYLNTYLRKKLSERIKIFGEDYFSKEVEDNAISQLDIGNEFFCNLISTPHFTTKEIESILEINI